MRARLAVIGRRGRAVLFGAAVATASVAGAVAWIVTHPPAPGDAASPAATSASASGARRPVVLASPERCEALRKEYTTALAPLRACTADAECVAEMREGALAGLAGCVRYRRRDADGAIASKLSPIESRFLAGGCSQHYVTCAPRLAQCVAGTCVERPPEGVPATWKRVAHGTVFSFFVPGDATAKEVQGDDSEGGTLEAADYEMFWEYGMYSPHLDAKADEGDTLVRSREVSVPPAKGTITVVRTREHGLRAGIHVPDVPALGRAPMSISMWSFCKTEKSCAEVERIVATIELH